MYRFIVASIIAISMLIPTFGMTTPARAQSKSLCEFVYFDLFDTSCGDLDDFNVWAEIYDVQGCKTAFKSFLSQGQLSKNDVNSLTNFLCNCTQKTCGFPASN